MADTETFKTLMQLVGKNDERLKKVLTFVEIMGKVQNEGVDEKVTLDILSQINPKIKPLVKLINTQKGGETKEDFVQYNRPQ